ncbi:MAG: M23 family metallopeptidase [Rhodospirillaceae bacterium]|nr:M23 family metallopeptidase [Rhodospirillaceae bacterium]MBT5373412.1 M23 family metallopeptidase [Rhodospirillaceae bacterium]MBT5752486.1 M23 family metallopeptidase [Rhodospirillaceae bacterium]
MSRVSLRLGLIILCLLGGLPGAVSHAGELPFGLRGAAVQGGLLRGQVPVGTKVWLGDQPVRVGENGSFLIGLSRRAQRSLTLRLLYPDGEVRQETFSITQRDYDIQRIDGLPAGQVSPSDTDLARIRRDSAAIKKARQVKTDTPLFEGDFIWPVTGIITGVYGSQRILNGEARSPHLGADIAADEGTPIRAPADGRVVLADDEMFFTGKTLLIDHGHGLVSVYAHMSALDVVEGAWVAKGDVVGRIGQTGRATGPHLHWGVHLNGVGLDPALLAGDMP